MGSGPGFLPLALSSTRIGADMWLVVVRGEIDMSDARRLAGKLESAIQMLGVVCVVADFTDVTFIDAAGLGALVEAHKVLARAGRKLEVIGADGPVARVLTLTGVGSLVGVAGSEAA
jgi:anti-anti-sigma factor